MGHQEDSYAVCQLGLWCDKKYLEANDLLLQALFILDSTTFHPSNLQYHPQRREIQHHKDYQPSTHHHPTLQPRKK